MKGLTRKTAFFEGWSWFRFNNLGLALGRKLKFYTSVAKGLKLKVRKFWGLSSTFVEVTVEKLVGRTLFASPPPLPPFWIGLTVLERDCITGISLWILWDFQKKFFCRTPGSHFSHDVVFCFSQISKQLKINSFGRAMEVRRRNS